jgi:hypothetical protein
MTDFDGASGVACGFAGSAGDSWSEEVLVVVVVCCALAWEVAMIKIVAKMRRARHAMPYAGAATGFNSCEAGMPVSPFIKPRPLYRD